MKDYYKELEICENASDEVIKAAYKTLVKKYHPDNCTSEMAKKKLLEINEAYSILGNSEKRKNYDSQYKEFLENNIKNKSQKPWTEEFERKEGKLKETNIRKDRGTVFRFFKDVGESVLHTMEKAELDYQDAYLKGVMLDDFELVNRYRKATGYKRNGFARALEERGFLEKDKNGRYFSTYKMRRYL